MRLDLPSAGERLIVRHWLHPLLPQRFHRSRILSQVELGANQDNGDIRGVMVDFGVPLHMLVNGLSLSHRHALSCITNLSLDVVERRRADDGEADEEYVGLRVRERPETVVILLSSSIPKPEADGLAINHYAR